VGEQKLPQIKTEMLNRLFSVFMALLALFCLGMGAFYWIRLIGVFPGDLWRFDLMPWQWRVLCAALAVFYPVAASGLWMGSRWGIILWLAGAVMESVCLTFYAGYFNWNVWIPALHVLFLVCYGVLNVLLLLSQPKKSPIAVEY